MLQTIPIDESDMNYDMIQKEFTDLVSLACNQVKESRNIDIKILNNEAKSVCSSQNTINIPDSFKKNLYEGIFHLNLVDNAVNTIIQNYHINEHPLYIKKLYIYIRYWLPFSMSMDIS